VKKLCLRPFLPRDKLDIVNQEDIHPSELVSELVHLLVAEGIDEFVGEFLGGGVRDLSYIGKDSVSENMISNRI